MSTTELIKNILPPAMVRAVRKIKGTQTPRPHGERPAEWYDQILEETDAYGVHYTASGFYPIWTVLIDRIRRFGPCSIFEIACGTGQLAQAIRESGLMKDYCGFDFAAKRIEQARAGHPDLRFEHADAFKTDLFESFDYDLVISTEFLEHVEEDLAVVQRIRPGVRFIGTVPSYTWQSHVRFFQDTGEVAERYGSYFSDFSVVPIIRNEKLKTIFILEGTKT